MLSEFQIRMLSRIKQNKPVFGVGQGKRSDTYKAYEELIQYGYIKLDADVIKITSKGLEYLNNCSVS